MTIIKPDPKLKDNLMIFGFECGRGWYPLIYELLDKLQNIVDSDDRFADVQVTQVKEKWGGLRVYLSFGSDEMFDLIDECKLSRSKLTRHCP